MDIAIPCMVAFTTEGITIMIMAITAGTGEAVIMAATAVAGDRLEAPLILGVLLALL